MSGMLKVLDVAIYLDCPQSYVRQQVKARAWPHHLVNGQIRFTPWVAGPARFGVPARGWVSRRG